jgi:hypothetical protein
LFRSHINPADKREFDDPSLYPAAENLSNPVAEKTDYEHDTEKDYKAQAGDVSTDERVNKWSEYRIGEARDKTDY